MSMNIYRLIGDASHVLAIIILFYKLLSSKSCAGISGKSQILFTIAYTARYTDLTTMYISMYNTGMKIMFLVTSYVTLYLIYFKYKKTREQKHDVFRIQYLLIPAAGLALIFHYKLDVIELLWTFSIYLEALAILPQLALVYNSGAANSTVSYYVLALAGYRGFYFINWIYRYCTDYQYDIISAGPGFVLTLLCFYTFVYMQWRVYHPKDPEPDPEVVRPVMILHI